MQHALVFVCCFLSISLRLFQSVNAVKGRAVVAFFVSLAISSVHLVALLMVVHEPHVYWVSYVLGNACGASAGTQLERLWRRRA